MNIIKIESKEKLDNFLKENNGSILQSFAWGEFQEKMGRRIWRLGGEENGQLELSVLLIKLDLSMGKSFLFCPKGPVFNNNQTSRDNNQTIIKHQETITKLLKFISEIVKKEKSLFFRMDLEWKIDNDKVELLKSLNFKKADKEVHPKDTWILDLQLSADDLFAKMHSKTRYNIRLAEKKGVKIEKIQNIDENIFDEFWQVMETTAKRDKFYLHEKKYYWEQLQILGREKMMNLFLARVDGRIAAGAMISFFGDNAVYWHGASDHHFRSFMAPNLLHWEIIKEAKLQNCKYYDFGGIKAENQVLYPTKETESWEGVSRFKRGFGGREINYVGAWEMVYQKIWYAIYNTVRKFF